MTTHYKFWMVFAEGGHAPSKQHFVKAEAETEAQRIAKKNGRSVYVLESVHGYMVPEPAVIMFVTADHAPQPADAA